MKNAAILNNRFLSRTNPEYIRAVDDGGDVLSSPEINKLMMQMVDMDIAKNLKLWVHSGLVETRVSGDDTFVPKAYDISGEENDAAQATTGNQPELVSDGMKFDGGQVLNYDVWSKQKDILESNNWATVLWAKVNDFSNFPVLWTVSRESDGRDSALLEYNNDGTQMYVKAGDDKIGLTSARTYTLSTAAGTEVWYFIVFNKTGAGDSADLYFDTILQTVYSGDVNDCILNSEQQGYMGAYRNMTAPLNGSINDIRFFNKALSSTEVTAIYNATKSKYGH